MTTSTAPTTPPAPSPVKSTGHLVSTASVDKWQALYVGRLVFVIQCIERHVRGDDGDLDADDKAINEHARFTGQGRVLSSYAIPANVDGALSTPGKLWIITDQAGDDTVTTVLFPEDY